MNQQYFSKNIENKITNFPANIPQVSKLLDVFRCACSRNLLVKLPGTIIWRRLYGFEVFLFNNGLVLLSTIGLRLKNKIDYEQKFLYILNTEYDSLFNNVYKINIRISRILYNFTYYGQSS